MKACAHNPQQQLLAEASGNAPTAHTADIRPRVLSKSCRKCAESKPLSEFPLDKSNPLGRATICNLCNRIKSRAWAKAHPQQHAARSKRYVQRHPERRAAYLKRYYQTEQGKAVNRRHSSKHDALKRQCADVPASALLTSAQWQKILQIQKGHCYWCERKRTLTQDHVIPLSKGGKHIASNIVAACRSCNCRKGARIITLF